MPVYPKSTWFLSAGLVAILWILFLSNYDPKKTPKEYLSNVKTAMTEWKPSRLISMRPGHDRPLILYAYSESDFARTNLGFFLRHALHGAAEFIFIFNGETDADSLVPLRKNIKVIKRANECYDLGAYAAVLMANNSTLAKKHKKFIMVNASLRGPFIPSWSNECWSDAVLRKVNDKVKLSGLTYNCHSGEGHLQSSLWATDSVGLSHMLTPQGIYECFAGYAAAIGGEVRMTPWMRSAGFEVEVFEMAYHMNDGAVRRKEHNVTTIRDGKYSEENFAFTDWKIGLDIDPTSIDPDPQPFYVGCEGEDINGNDSYWGRSISPWEVMFVKTNRKIDPVLYDTITQWVDGSGYSSYDHCK